MDKVSERLSGEARALTRTFRRCLVGMLVAMVTTSGSAETELPQAESALQAIFDGRPPNNSEELRAMQAHITKLADAVSKCTVSVQYKSAHGSGVLVSRDGYVLTVAHVVGQPNQIVQVRFADGRIVQGRSLGMHRELDAGLVKLLEPGPWNHLQLAKQKKPPNGLWCAAIGHPGGYDRERGPVFRLGRVLSAGELIRTDCQLVGGDSGGPLIDMKGQVIGIHSRIGVSLSTNLHVPIHTFRSHWDELVDGKLWRSKAFIGLRGESDTTTPRVALVHEDSPAERAGIRIGDVIMRFNGVTIDQFPDLVQLVRQHQPGENVRLTALRGEEILDFKLTIGRRN